VKKVCYADMGKRTLSDDRGQYTVDTFDPFEYFSPNDRFANAFLLTAGSSGWNKRAALRYSVEGADRLYRERDPSYMRMAGDFIDRFRDYDLIVMPGCNFIHPELLWRELKKPVKILGFIDDPHSTYVRGLPHLWAFDGAFYISPSYIDDMLFSDAFARWGKPAYWFPLTAPQQKPIEADDAFFRNRDMTAVYVGGPYTSKVNRLIKLKRHFGNRFCVYGRWSFRGYSGFIRALFGRPMYPYRVKSLTNEERTNIYWRTKIGFNMHLSDEPFECGNARTYEVPAHGMALISDKRAANGQSKIFESNKEALYYSSLSEAIDMIEHYAAHDDERVAIAKAGFDRFWRDYQYEDNMFKFFDWALSLRK
jgi:hypothetical protein